MSNIILFECNKELTTIPKEYNTFHLKLLLSFYLKNGICYSGEMNQMKSSRNIEMNINENSISFFKRDNELKEINVTLPLDYIITISTYTPFVSFKHYYYISNILNHFNNSNLIHRFALSEENKNLILKDENPVNIQLLNIHKNSLNKNKVNKLINNVRTNISTNLKGNSVTQALSIIKDMEENDKIKYILLFVIYFFPLDILDKSISNFVSSFVTYIHNTKDYLKRILLSYIIDIYPKNKELANKNTNILFTYFYNTQLFKIYDKLFKSIHLENSIRNYENISKSYLNNVSNISNETNETNKNNINCKLHKFYSQKSNCNLNNYEINNIKRINHLKKYSLTENMVHLLDYVKGKGNSQREITIHIERGKNLNKNYENSYITVHDKNKNYKFSYNLINNIAEKSVYISLHQLLTIQSIYNDLESNILKNYDLFDYLIATILYLYGNREFKDKVQVQLYNLPTKKNIQLSNNKKSDIINKIIKMYIYLHKQEKCSSNKIFISILKVNHIINYYNQYMDNKDNMANTILHQLMYITSCNPNQNLKILNENSCLPIKSCKLVKKSIISNVGKKVSTIFGF